ncbi:helix-turn-helix domain-containing protein [Sphingomonas sp. MMS24-J13]|uniref:helix-turn-helix domain-containing protein n=1 Tax=Sphingomonas sp. MMS24-J13 TaxID=3238686 RepID=UPI00384B9FEB
MARSHGARKASCAGFEQLDPVDIVERHQVAGRRAMIHAAGKGPPGNPANRPGSRVRRNKGPATSRARRCCLNRQTDLAVKNKSAGKRACMKEGYMLVEQLTTADWAPKDRLPYWNNLRSRMVGSFRVKQLDDGFSALMRRVSFPQCQIVSVLSSPAQVIGQGDYSSTMLNLQIQQSGRSLNRVGGRICDLDEGDFLLYDPSDETHHEYDRQVEFLFVRLPLSKVEQRLPHLRQAVGLKKSGKGGPAALFSHFLRSAWREFNDGDQGAWVHAVDDVIWSMLDLAYASERPEAGGRQGESRRRALFQVIADNLCDPDLSVHHIAKALGVSVRYVQMMFAQMATTPSAYIQNQRLDLAGARLLREGARCSITGVAFDVGFNDLSSFCRAFRRRFNVSPREYRAGVQGDARKLRREH